ncbi:hypothetical protein PYW08_004089 [Mythimna loreyi]|uniref:Uncharacterized protein n=1 Tax=Mythimna loreyi TaxID=667449 RepID=A0ACC2QV06_9NEOP|nr:hypothetical protein PYW08_004089 [Mythimna loreyi]
MPPLILHRVLGSPPARAVMMLSELLKLQVQFNDVKLLQGEHKTPEFKKLNPMGTVPVLQDGDFVLSDSHAIMKYLVSVYGGDKRESLYPSDVRTRALLDQAMFFNAGVFFKAFTNVTRDTFLGVVSEPTPQHIEEIESSFEVVDAYVRERPYIATDRLTIADLAAGSTAATMKVFHKPDPDRFPHCVDWVSRLEEEHVFKTIMTPGVVYFTKVMNALWKRNKENKE